MVKKKYIVNWDDIKFTTRRDAEYVFCTLEFGEKYMIDYSKNKGYYCKAIVKGFYEMKPKGYSPKMFDEGFSRMIPKSKFILEKEIQFIKSLIITRAYYDEVIWLEKEHKL